MAEEMRAHLEEQTLRNLAAGMSEVDARAAAHRQFGGVAQIQERARDVRSWVWLEQLLQDGRHALRQIGRNPGFTSAIVLTLALGIAACTAIFSLVDALLFRPLPVRDAASLLAVEFVRDNGSPAGPLPAAYVQAFREQSDSFSELTAYATIFARLRIGEQTTKNAVGQIVPNDFFEVLGVRPLLGRTLAAGNSAAPDPGPVALISHACWQNRFGADPDVLGQTLQVDRETFGIIGVLPPEFTGLSSWYQPLFWVPITMERAIGMPAGYDVIARLAPQVTPVQAASELDSIARNLAQEHDSRPMAGFGFQQPRHLDHATLHQAALGSWSGKRDDVERLGMLFGGAVGLVLLVACSNAASLLLVRSLRRRREIAVRVALGATRNRLVRQLLIESLLLSVLAAGAGILLAHWGTDGVLALRAGWFANISVEPRVDGRVLTFASALTMLTGVVFGLLPALQALRFDVNGILKQEAATATARFRGLAPRNLLILAQVTVCLVLLLGAGLCLRSFAKLLALEPGFDRHNVLAIAFETDAEFTSPGADRERTRQIIERVSLLPGVRAATVCDRLLPLSGVISFAAFDQLEGYAKQPDEQIHVRMRSAGPGYFHLLGIAIVQGREFDLHDLAGTANPVIVNEAFVRRYWPDQNPLGKHLRDAEIVGVARDVRDLFVWHEAEPQMFSLSHHGFVGGPITLLVRTEDDPLRLAPLIQREAAAVAAPWRVQNVDTLVRIWSDSLAGPRLTLVLLATFSGVALVLATIGLYGFVACSVVQRTREIGIRVAVGARRIDILSLVVRQGMVIVVVGLGCGLLIALAATRALVHLLHEVAPTDPVTFVCVPLLLAATALVACWLPARRAAKVDPVIALRAE